MWAIKGFYYLFKFLAAFNVLARREERCSFYFGLLAMRNKFLAKTAVKSAIFYYEIAMPNLINHGITKVQNFKKLLFALIEIHNCINFGC